MNNTKTKENLLHEILGKNNITIHPNIRQEIYAAMDEHTQNETRAKDKEIELLKAANEWLEQDNKRKAITLNECTIAIKERNEFEKQVEQFEAEKQTHAVEFAEWLGKNCFTRNSFGIWIQANDSRTKPATIQELYEKFKNK